MWKQLLWGRGGLIGECGLRWGWVASVQLEYRRNRNTKLGRERGRVDRDQEPSKGKTTGQVETRI